MKPAVNPEVPARAAPSIGTDPIDGLSAALGELKELDIQGLRQRWRKLYRTSAPDHLPRWLLLRIIAYRMQAAAQGDLDRETVRFLERVAAERERRRAGGERSSKKPPPIPRVPDKQFQGKDR